ncbi:MAG: hypothetical protein ACI83D_000401 [Planctomycetota bacterium]|jgi:hypothetical protein
MATQSVWGEIFFNSLQNLWFGVVDIVPKIIIALLVFLIGWLVAVLIERGVAHIIKFIKLDSLLEHTGLDEVLKKAGFRLDSGLFIGALFKWFIIVLFLKLSLGIVELVQVDMFLDKVLLYLPSVIVAVLVLFVGAIVADAMAKIVSGSAKAAGINASKALGTVTRWIIWIFAILISLTELQIGVEIVLAVVYGLIAMMAIGGGIAFGLGGRDAAKDAIETMKDSLKGRK